MQPAPLTGTATYWLGKCYSGDQNYRCNPHPLRGRQPPKDKIICVISEDATRTPYGDGNLIHAENIADNGDATRTPYGDGNLPDSSLLIASFSMMQPAPLTGTATTKRYSLRRSLEIQPAPLTGTATNKDFRSYGDNLVDATRAPYGDGNMNARKNRKIGITDATRAPHGDGN